MSILNSTQSHAIRAAWKIISSDWYWWHDTEIATREEVISAVLDADKPKHFFPYIDFNGFFDRPLEQKILILRMEVFKDAEYEF